jgi:hypothetical protein
MNTENTETQEEVAKEIQDAKLSLVAQHAAADLKQLIAEKETEMLEAMAQVAEEASLQDKKPIFKIGFGISLDTDGDKMKTVLTFSVKRQLEIERPMPDPTQPELPLDEGADIAHE